MSDKAQPLKPQAAGLPGIVWTPGEAAALNEFLSSPLGRKWIEVLYMRKPKVSMMSTEQAALTGAVAAGYEMVFHEMGALRAVVQQPDPGPRGIDPTRD